MSALDKLISSAESLMARLEALLPLSASETDWQALAWRWEKHASQTQGQLVAVDVQHAVKLADLFGIESQKEILVQNTAQFVAGFSANNALLTGASGTGKSSIVKALLHAFADQGLRVIEVDKSQLVDLLQIAQLIQARSERFIIYCDDLSFEANDTAYKALKVVLDGSVQASADNFLVYATSNRRNLMPEFMQDNAPLLLENQEVRPNDTIEEKTALAERFGLRLVFYPSDQASYLQIAAHWLKQLGQVDFDEAAKKAALQWSYQRGAKSGRVAYQFARDYVGRLQLNNIKSQ